MKSEEIPNLLFYHDKDKKIVLDDVDWKNYNSTNYNDKVAVRVATGRMNNSELSEFIKKWENHQKFSIVFLTEDTGKLPCYRWKEGDYRTKKINWFTFPIWWLFKRFNKDYITQYVYDLREQKPLKDNGYNFRLERNTLLTLDTMKFKNKRIRGFGKASIEIINTTI